jgi:LysR family transcriptional regulator, carnitine catabolism transcriptional activator
LSIPSIAHLLLPNIIKAYRQQHPHVVIEVHDHPDPTIRAKLARGEGDFAILSAYVSQEKLKYLPLFKDHLRWVGAADHALAAIAKINMKDLKHQQLILMRGGAIREMSEPLSQSINSSLPIIEVDQQSTLLGMVSAGIGISFLPSLSCQSAVNHSAVHRAIAGDPCFRTIQLTRSLVQDLMPSSIAFVKLLLSLLTKQKTKFDGSVELLKFDQKSIDHFLN